MPIQTAFSAASNTTSTAKIDHSAALSLLSSVTVSMIAATSTTQAPSVILKWVVDDQWIPENGYNLYRKGSDDAAFKKIAGPIIEKQNPGIVKIKGFDGKERILEIAALSKQAKLKVAIPADMIHMFKPRLSPVEPSTQIFNEMQVMKQQQTAPFKGQTRVGFGRTTADQFPKLNAYVKRFQIKTANAALSEAAKTVVADQAKPTQMKSLKINSNAVKTKLKTVAKVVSSSGPSMTLDSSMKSQPQVVMEARKQLIMASLLNSTVNNALGMGYVDSNVKSGQTYEYQLRGNQI